MGIAYRYPEERKLFSPLRNWDDMVLPVTLGQKSIGVVHLENRGSFTSEQRQTCALRLEIQLIFLTLIIFSLNNT